MAKKGEAREKELAIFSYCLFSAVADPRSQLAPRQPLSLTQIHSSDTLSSSPQLEQSEDDLW